MTALKPCPLCDSYKVHVAENEWGSEVWSVRCDGCNTDYGLNEPTREKAIEKWNHRQWDVVDLYRRFAGEIDDIAYEIFRKSNSIQEMMRTESRYYREIADQIENGSEDSEGVTE